MSRLLPRTLRLDPSDGVVFQNPAAPGEWAVAGGFAFWDEDPASMTGKRRQEFRSGFLGLGSFGWSTLVEVAPASDVEAAAALDALAQYILHAFGAPDAEAARAAAGEEIAFAASLCAGHDPGTVLALARTIEDGAQREAFRTLHRRAAPRDDFGALPVFGIIEVTEDETPLDMPDLLPR